MKNKFFRTALLVATAALLLSCGNSVRNNANYIKVGVASGPEYVIAQIAQKVAKEKFNLEVELISFSDYIMPNTALHQKDIDVNVFQTRPFLEEQSKQRRYDFAVAGNTFVYPMAVYSRKIKTLDELKDGSAIVIPNDAANGGRALLLLGQAGLIKLKQGCGYTPRLVDIEKNARCFYLVELEAPQLPRVLDDNDVIIAVINNNFAAKAGLFLHNSIYAEDKDSPYVNLIVARTGNKDEEKVRKFVQAYQSEEVVEAAYQAFKGGAIRGW
ncbi:D-methionine-binding lipoprotein MetQ [termite gut metagenome]|uniref:D-methionine-binding lipoprotein MetQ n=1 Tax=termite gut metagenome TaxID=433724 RepID=A0A5J4SL15_9ZZZZ